MENVCHFSILLSFSFSYSTRIPWGNTRTSQARPYGRGETWNPKLGFRFPDRDLILSVDFFPESETQVSCYISKKACPLSVRAKTRANFQDRKPKLETWSILRPVTSQDKMVVQRNIGWPDMRGVEDSLVQARHLVHFMSDLIRRNREVGSTQRSAFHGFSPSHMP
jgi:hypothetical protein